MLILSTALFGQNPKTQLNKAYKKHTPCQLYGFFQQWQAEIPTITQNEFNALDNIQQNAYKAFSAFYKPHRTDSIGGSEFGTDIYKNVTFLIVQNQLIINSSEKVYYTAQDTENYVVAHINEANIHDSVKTKLLERQNGQLSELVLDNFGPNHINTFPEYKPVRIDSIGNFRPPVYCNGKFPLYLTSKYEKILTSFLGNQYVSLGKGGIMNPAHAKGKSNSKKIFLEKHIHIYYGHWGGYWQLLSYPQVYSITFDKDMNYALIDYRMIYEGGCALLKNEDGNWKIIDVHRTWIE